VKQCNNLKISPRSLTNVSPESCGVIFLLAISVSVNVSYIISEILDVEMTTQAELTFKCHSRLECGDEIWRQKTRIMGTAI